MNMLRFSPDMTKQLNGTPFSDGLWNASNFNRWAPSTFTRKDTGEKLTLATGSATVYGNNVQAAGVSTVSSLDDPVDNANFLSTVAMLIGASSFLPVLYTYAHLNFLTPSNLYSTLSKQETSSNRLVDRKLAYRTTADLRNPAIFVS
jgi:hypothetical protein